MKKPAVVFIHFAYWLGYLLLLLFLYSAIRAGAGSRGPGMPGFYMLMASGFAIVPGISGFYISYFLLFPRFLNRRRIVLLCIYGLLFSVMCGLLGEATLTLLIGGVGDNRSDLVFPNYQPSEILVAVVLTTFVAFLNMVVGLVTRGFITAYGDIKLKEDLNRKNYEMELALVKSQLNPHFLFNTINNIDVLIMKDAEKASAYLNKLSDIMRFMLYETKTEQILLARELEYIGKYIDLQKIRSANPHFVSYEVQGEAGSTMTGPMLFIPFIENAFKHSENKKLENAIAVRISIDEEEIVFCCENKCTENALEKERHSGLGNQLIRKRLSLLYPGMHTLETIHKNNTYAVTLTLKK